MPPTLRDLVDQLRANGFRELAGSRLALRVPLAESLLNRVLADQLAARPGPVRELRIRPGDGNRAVLHVRPARPAFLPALGIDVQIYRQPRFPDDPVLILRWSSLPGLAALASMALRFIEVLPPGVRVLGEVIAIDLRVLLVKHGLGEALPLVEKLEVGTASGAVVVSIELRVP